jgi:hypothetical protein
MTKAWGRPVKHDGRGFPDYLPDDGVVRIAFGSGHIADFRVVDAKGVAGWTWSPGSMGRSSGDVIAYRVPVAINDICEPNEGLTTAEAQSIDTWIEQNTPPPTDDPADPAPLDRDGILDAARACVTRDRAATHGDAERSFTRIAAYWSTHLGHRVTAVDIPVMMALLKMARIGGNPAHLDSWIDGCGYLACGGEIAADLARRPF